MVIYCFYQSYFLKNHIKMLTAGQPKPDPTQYLYVMNGSRPKRSEKFLFSHPKLPTLIQTNKNTLHVT